MTLDPFADEPPPPPSKKDFRRGLLVGSILGCVGCILFSVVGTLFVIGVLSETGTMPGTEVVTGEQLPDDVHEMLIAEGIIEPDETILHYYSTGFLSYREDGNLYTDRRVISYWEVGDEIDVSEATYHQIKRIEPEYKESFLEDTVIWIHGETDGEEWTFDLYASHEGGRDTHFVEGLMETWERER